MIADRPAIVAERSRFGDFEADTMWLAGKAVVVAVNDRVTGLGYSRVLADRKSDRVHKAIIVAPILERVDYDLIVELRKQCIEKDVPFRLHQTGAHLLKDGRLYHIRRQFQIVQANKANLNYRIGGDSKPILK